MKINRTYRISVFVAIIACIFSVTSCESYLDVNPEMGVSPEEVYSDYDSANQALNRAYRLVRDYCVTQVVNNAFPVGTLGDEAQQTNLTVTMATTVNKGNWYNGRLCDIGFVELGIAGESNWAQGSNNYNPATMSSSAIRAINLLIANIDNIERFPEVGTEDQTNPDILKTRLLGQCYFLRAWHFFQIINRYGGMPKMDKVFDVIYEFDELRPEYQESVENVISDCDLAIENLPDDWEQGYDKGRVTKLSAMALKGMALLYASSPTMNTPRADYMKENKNLYSEAFLERAVKAIAEAIDYYESGKGTKHRYYMYDWGKDGETYSENWYRPGNNAISDEAIFQPIPSSQAAPSTSLGVGNAWFANEWEGGFAYPIVPTQNAVDRFGTADGYDVSDPEAITSGSFDDQDPYSNRDPRLKRFVYVHKSQMFGKTASLQIKAANFNTPMLIEGKAVKQTNLFSGMQGDFYHMYQKDEVKHLFTGYALRKHRWDLSGKIGKTKNYSRYFPHIRVPQLYLDYAEAVNELEKSATTRPTVDGVAKTYTAQEAIDIVRARIDGLAPIQPKYAKDYTVFREQIRRERGVELFQEFHRWHDMRRWRIAEEVLSKPIQGAYIAKQGKTVFYDKFDVAGADRVFEKKHYWYPFGSNIIDMMSTFEENPGW